MALSAVWSITGHRVRRAVLTMRILAVPFSLGMVLSSVAAMMSLDWSHGGTEYQASILYIIWGVLSAAYFVSYFVVQQCNPNAFYVSISMDAVLLTLLCFFGIAGLITAMWIVLVPRATHAYFTNVNQYRDTQWTLLTFGWILLTLTVAILLTTTIYVYGHFDRCHAVWSKSLLSVITDDPPGNGRIGSSDTHRVVDDMESQVSSIGTSSRPLSIDIPMVEPYPSLPVTITPVAGPYSTFGGENLPQYSKHDPSTGSGPSRFRPSPPTRMPILPPRVRVKETVPDTPDEYKFAILQLERRNSF